MARIQWNAVGERFFEGGVDRGVLFVDGHSGVPWNGLISISEKTSGGRINSYYLDGIKYVHYSVLEEFSATIEAFTYPDLFGLCDGTKLIRNGLFVKNQPKKNFGLCYRTLMGNDAYGFDLGYKIHIVYNAIASATQRSNDTFSEALEPSNFTWDVETVAPTFRGANPSAHFIIDSTETPEPLLQKIEDILYGSSESAPRLPSAAELLFIFNTFLPDVLDAGLLVDEYFETVDGGDVWQSEIIVTADGGTP